MKNNDNVKTSPKAKLIKDIEPTKHEVPEKKVSSWKKPSTVTVDVSPPVTKSEANKPDVLQRKSSSWKKPAITPSANGVEQQSSTSSSQKNKSSSSDEKCAVPAIPANNAIKTTLAQNQPSTNTNIHRENKATPVTTNTKPSTPDVSNKIQNEVKQNKIVEPLRHPIKKYKVVERDEEKEAIEFEKELKETEKKAVEEAKRSLRPIPLNIDQNARSKDQAKKSTEIELSLLKTLCGEVREIAKASNPEEKEERKKEMEKVRTARSEIVSIETKNHLMLRLPGPTSRLVINTGQSLRVQCHGWDWGQRRSYLTLSAEGAA